MFYIFLFLTLMGTGVGLFPVPEDIIILSAGVGIEQELGNVFVVFCVALIGIILSDFLIFLVGRKIGKRAFESKFFNFFLPQDKVESVQKMIEGHSKKVIFIGRFTSGFRPIVLFCAGMSDIKIKFFIWIDFLASLIYIPFLLFLGYRFSYDITELIKDFSRIYHAIEIIIILVIVGWLVLRLSKKFFNGKIGNGVDNGK